MIEYELDNDGGHRHPRNRLHPRAPGNLRGRENGRVQQRLVAPHRPATHEPRDAASPQPALDIGHVRLRRHILRALERPRLVENARLGERRPLGTGPRDMVDVIPGEHTSPREPRQRRHRGWNASIEVSVTVEDAVTVSHRRHGPSLGAKSPSFLSNEPGFTLKNPDPS